jgi:HTH-type transcriptional regulator/antitoxin HigA
MKPKVIRTEGEWRAALARIDQIMDADRGTPEGDELELLGLLAEQYEERRFPIDLPDPIAAIRFRMEQANLRPKDLVPYLGSRSRVTEILNGTRPLSLNMIRKLHSGLGIPAEVLLRKAGGTLPETPEGLRSTTRQGRSGGGCRSARRVATGDSPRRVETG